MSKGNDLIDRTNELVAALRERAGYAREEGGGTAIGDARYFETAAATIASLSEALAEAEKKGAEVGWMPIETAPRDARVFLGWDGYNIWPCAKLDNSQVLAIGQKVLGIMDGKNVTHWRPLPSPPRDLSQGGQP